MPTTNANPNESYPHRRGEAARNPESSIWTTFGGTLPDLRKHDAAPSVSPSSGPGGTCRGDGSGDARASLFDRDRAPASRRKP